MGLQNTSERTLSRLHQAGAVIMYEDDFGEKIFTINPQGVRYELSARIDRLTYDVHHVRHAQEPSSRHDDNLTKVELLYELFSHGFAPIDYLDTETQITPDSRREVFVGNWNQT